MKRYVNWGVAVILATGVVRVQGDTIKLTTGESLQVEIVEITPETVVVDHAVLGRLVIERKQVETIVPAGAAAVAEAPAPVVETIVAENSPAASPWESNFALGFGAQSGNTETTNINLIVTTKRELATQRTALDARFYYGQENGDKNANRFTAGGIHDWLIEDSRWSYFVDGRYDYDDFNSWQWRLSGHGGFGYELIQRDDLTLLLRAGAGAAKEFKSLRNQLIPEALLGAELDWTISARQGFTFGSTLFPDLDDTGEFRNITAAAWKYSLDDSSGLALNFGLYNEYQSKTDPGIDQNDLRLFGGLSFDF